MNPIPWLGLAFVLAVVTTFTLARVAERFGRRMGVLDVPRAGEVQRWSAPRVRRRKITHAASRIGTPSTRMAVPSFAPPRMPLPARPKPNSSEPELPMKIVAGGRLRPRKPRHTPARASGKSATEYSVKR